MTIEKYQELYRLLTNFDPLLESENDERGKTLACTAMLLMQIKMLEDFKPELQNEELEAKLDLIVQAFARTAQTIISIYKSEP